MKTWKLSPASKIAITYAAIGAAWVLLSDKVAESLFTSSYQLSIVQTYKGWFYILITAWLIFVLIKNSQTAQNKTRQKLQETEQQYRTLVEKLPAAVFMDEFNDPATPRYMSPQIKELLGYTPEEWGDIDRLWENSIHPEDRARVIAEDHRTDQTGEPFNIEYRLRHRDGHYIWVRENTSLIRGENGEPLFWQGILTDITQQKQIEQTTQRQLKELIILHTIAKSESVAQNLDELLQSITDVIGNSLYPDNCGFHLLDEIKGELVTHFSYHEASHKSLAVSVPKTQGIIGKVATTGKAIRAGDVSQEPVYYEVASNIQSELCVPIINESKVIGTINVESKEQNAFTENDERLLNTIAGGISNFIKRIRLFELEQSRRQKAEILMNATTALTNLLDIPSLYNAILDWLYKITPYDSATIFEIEKGGIRATAARGIPNPEAILGSLFPLDNLLCKTICETGKPIIIADCQQDARFDNWADATYIHGWLGVPMISRGQVIGQIDIDSRTPNAFTENDAIAAQTFAHQAATSLENIRLFTETRQRLEELEIISRVSSSLRAAHETKEMFPILLDEIKHNMEAESAAIWLYNHDTKLLEAKASCGRFKKLSLSYVAANEGVVGNVYSSGVNIISSETASADFLSEDWVSATVPIRTDSGVIGVISVATNPPHEIKAHQIRLITTLAEIAGNAIHRSNLYERSEKQISQLTTLRELDTAIASSLDLRITLNILVENMISKTDAAAVAVLIFNPDSQMLEYGAAAGFNNREFLHIPINIGDEAASKVLLSREAQYIHNIKAESNPRLKTLLQTEKITSYYAIPLFSKGATRGILEIYFRTPFTLSADWEEYMHTLAGQATIAIDNAQLFENLQRTNQELSLAYDTTLEGWGKALELRDKETEGHTRRVTDLTLNLAQQMNIPEAELLNIRRGALLHDIGKMGVRDNILRKKGALTKQETIEMRKHPQYAYELLSPITYLRPAIDIAYSHHEWWDGSGYPRGLKGEEIPLAARIFAVIDVWDALLSNRPYRRAWTDKKTLKYIKSLSGKQFDPRVVEAFCEMIDKTPPTKKLR